MTTFSGWRLVGVTTRAEGPGEERSCGRAEAGHECRTTAAPAGSDARTGRAHFPALCPESRDRGPVLREAESPSDTHCLKVNAPSSRPTSRHEGDKSVPRVQVVPCGNITAGRLQRPARPRGGDTERKLRLSVKGRWLVINSSSLRPQGPLPVSSGRDRSSLLSAVCTCVWGGTRSRGRLPLPGTPALLESQH